MADARDRVAAYLASEGFPLEFATAQVFRDAGLSVTQGTHYRSDEDKVREIDVLASRVMPGNTLVGTSWVIECKEAPLDNGSRIPWVMFSAPPHPDLPDADLIPASDVGHAALWAHAGDPDLRASSWIIPPGRRAFSGRLCRKGGDDAVFSALQSVSSAASVMSERASDLRNVDGRLLAFIYFPLIVVRSGLFEAHWDGASGQLIIEERSCIPALWTGLNGTGYPIRIDVVTLEHLKSYVSDRMRDIGVLDSTLARGREIVVEALARRSPHAALAARKGTPYLNIPRILPRTS